MSSGSHVTRHRTRHRFGRGRLQAQEEQARVEDGRITEGLATMQVIFVLEGAAD